MRITIRLNKEEEAKLNLLMAMTGIDDKSTALKFAVDHTTNNVKIVTDALISPEWEVIFSRKGKTNPSKKVLYFEK